MNYDLKDKEVGKVTLELVNETEYLVFQDKLQEAFAIAVVEHFGDDEGEHIPPDEDVQESLHAPGAAVYHIMLNGEKVGGVVLNINTQTNHNSIDLFYIYPDCQSRGIGYAALKAIERQYSETKVWELGTPYFEKRNISFYVNKCGFHIVEFYNKYHPDPHIRYDENDEKQALMEEDGFFRFEKIMK